jgi:uncharacterized protein
MQQPPSQAIHIDFDVPVGMRDGTVLRANVYRPAGDGRWPVLLTRLPYGKDLPGAGFVLDPVQAARRGYVVVVQDTRGRFRSEGAWEPFRHEAEDGFDTIGWAAGLPEADGQVGMYGASYFGFTQWSAATQAPLALRAMVPYITWADPLNGLASRGGAFELGTLANWFLGTTGADVLVRRHRGDHRALGAALGALFGEYDALGPEGYASLPLAEFGPLKRQDVAPAFFEALAVATDRAGLEPLTILGKHDRVRVPTFNIGGWYDIFLADTLAHYRAMRALGRPTKLLVGPWAHGRSMNPIGELNFGFGAQTALIDLQQDLGSLQLRWFDHWLKGIDSGLLAEPPVRLFVMGANVWRDEPDWPLARAVDTPLYLRAGGRLSAERPGADEPPDRYTYDPRDPVPTRGGALLMTPEYPPGPFDQRAIEARPDVLVYTTPPLEHDTEVTGPIRLRLWAGSSAPDTDFVARLLDVYPDGRSINLTDGILRARFRGAARSEPPSLIEPGRPYAYDIDLWATSNLFRAGHRIGLHVTSSSFPRWDRNPNTGHPPGADAELSTAQQAVLHDAEHPSCLSLPVVPG